MFGPQHLDEGVTFTRRGTANISGRGFMAPRARFDAEFDDTTGQVAGHRLDNCPLPVRLDEASTASADVFRVCSFVFLIGQAATTAEAKKQS